MADINKLVPLIFKWEGDWSNNKNDKGGATNMGITLSTWKSQGYDKDRDGDIDINDLKLVTKQDVIEILRKNYWNRWRADQIQNQSIANLLVDWIWNSGVHGIKIPQKVLGVTVDGLVGNKTIDAINKSNPEVLFNKLKQARREFFIQITRNDKTQLMFLKGWLNRLDDFKFVQTV
jgi:Putative secretion activating protein